MEPDESRVARVRDALRQLGHEPEMLISASSTHTAQEAAAAAGCELGQIVKTLVVEVGGNPVFVLVAGDRRLDDRLVATRWGVGRKQVKLAGPDRVLELTGYPIGGVSPFGATVKLDVVIDESFQRFEDIWLAGGTASAIFRMQLADVVRVTGGEFAAIAT